ncbi:unnamed protein product [Schistosoma bovis]|nr:unnamed protein product [Schistosoma bovis]
MFWSYFLLLLLLSSSSSSLLKSSYNELNNNELWQKYAKHTIQLLEKNQTLFNNNNNNITTNATTNDNSNNNNTPFTNRIPEINDMNGSSTRNKLKLNIEHFNSHSNNRIITSSPQIELTISNNNDNNTSINLSTTITNTNNITTINKNDNHWNVNTIPVCSTFYHTPQTCSFDYNNNNKLNNEQETIDKLTPLESENLIHHSNDHIDHSPIQHHANNTMNCNVNNSTCSSVSNELYDQNLPCTTPEQQQQQQAHSTTNTTTTTSTSSTIHINGAVHNTLRKTRSDMKVIHRYLIQIKHDTREIHQIPCHELDSYIQDFVLTAKKKDGHEYEPESLKAFVHSLERHLKHHGYSHSVLKGNAFAGTRSVLNQRLNELRALSRSGVSTNGAYAYSSNGANNHNNSNKRVSGVGNDSTSENRPINYTRKHNSNPNGLSSAELLQARILGTDNPQAILNSLWLMNRTQFNIGGTQRHRNLVWGQFQLITDDNGIKAIKFTPLFESAEVRYCRGYGGTRGGAANHDPLAKTQPLSCTGSAKRQPLPFNCVELFEIYANLRPLEARGVSEPFYLCPDINWDQNNQNGICNSWFKTNAAGSQLLSRIPRSLGLKPSKEPISISGINSSNIHKLQTSNSLIPNEIKDSDRLFTDHCNQILSNLSNYRDIYQIQSQNNTITNDHHHNNNSHSNNYYFNNLSRSISNNNLISQNLFNFFPFLFPPTPSSSAAAATITTTTTATTLASSVDEQSLTCHSLLNASIPLPSILQNLNSSLFQQTFKENVSTIREEYNNSNIDNNNSNNNNNNNNNNNSDNFPFSHEQFEEEQCGHNSTRNKISSPTTGDEDDDSRGEGGQIDVNEGDELEVDDEETQNIKIINSNCFSPTLETEPEIENLSTLDDNSSKLLTKLSSTIRNDLLHSPDRNEQYESVVNSSHHSKSLSSSSCLSSSSPSSASSCSSSADIGTFNRKTHHHRHHHRHPHHPNHQSHSQRLEIKSTRPSYQQVDDFNCRLTDNYNKEHWSSSESSSSSSPSPRLTTPLSTTVTNTTISIASSLLSTTPSSTPLIKSTTSILARFNKIA